LRQEQSAGALETTQAWISRAGGERSQSSFPMPDLGCFEMPPLNLTGGQPILV